MKFEFSAGGVVYKKDPSTSSGQGSLKILVAQHSQHHGWVFPKGIIGDHVKGEKKEETAVREVEEETGVKAKIVHELASVQYWYQWEGEKRKKTVYYYVMIFIEGDFEKRDMEMETVEWLLPEDVLERLSYKSDKKVWKEAWEYINSL